MKPISNFLILVLVFSIPCLLTTGCSDETKPDEPTGSLISASDCKFMKDGDKIPPPNYSDCIAYDYALDGTLTLWHTNTALNCCPDYEATVTVDGSIITITEHEIEGACNCLCLYDLSYEILMLPIGDYRLVVEQEYLNDESIRHDMDLPLYDTPSGEWCITRAIYPWGT